MSIFSSIAKFLLRVARNLLADVIADLIKQKLTLQDQALNPMKQIVEQVLAGDIWRGEGAEAFVEEVSSIFIPWAGRVGDNIDDFSNSIIKARDVIDQAETQVNTIVKSVEGTFASI